MSNHIENINNRAFTLAEMLVVLAVLSLMSVLILTIFTRTLRGSNKSQILSSIKQNGQAVLEVMDKTIRGADSLVCLSFEPSESKTIVIETKGSYTRYRIVLDPTQKTNGAIRQDIVTRSTDEVANIRVFIDRVCNPDDPLGTTSTLTDTNPQTGVQIISGSFTKPSPQAGFKDSITIKFELGPGVEAPKAVAGQIDPVTFQTTVQIR